MTSFTPVSPAPPNADPKNAGPATHIPAMPSTATTATTTKVWGTAIIRRAPAPTFPSRVSIGTGHDLRHQEKRRHLLNSRHRNISEVLWGMTRIPTVKLTMTVIALYISLITQPRSDLIVTNTTTKTLTTTMMMKKKIPTHPNLLIL